jgi:ketosteroid isomerase-like protein
MKSNTIKRKTIESNTMGLNHQLAQQFFKATAAGDIQTLNKICAEDFQGSQNAGPIMSLQALTGFTLAVLKRVNNFHYENGVTTESENGFVEEHDVVADLPDGSTLRLPVCVVAEVTDDRIVAMREYFDSRAATGLLKLLNSKA